METENRWDLRYGAPEWRPVAYDGWLNEYENALCKAENALELGCGDGADAEFLVRRVKRLTSCDLSPRALARLRARVPGAQTRMLDITRPLPFESASVNAVVADLCLHYFPWRETRAAAAEILRVLAPGGRAYVRVNALEEYAPAEGDLPIETHYYRLASGEKKRFFDEADLRRLFSDFDILSIKPNVTGKYGHGDKKTWFAAVQKAGSPERSGT